MVVLRKQAPNKKGGISTFEDLKSVLRVINCLSKTHGDWWLTCGKRARPVAKMSLRQTQAAACQHCCVGMDFGVKSYEQEACDKTTLFALFLVDRSVSMSLPKFTTSQRKNKTKRKK